MIFASAYAGIAWAFTMAAIKTIATLFLMKHLYNEVLSWAEIILIVIMIFLSFGFVGDYDV